MNNVRSEIITLIIDKVGVRETEITNDIDINEGLGCSGDDFHELMDEFAKKFNVDMSNYLWYFHTEEEGFNSLGGSFFRPPNERVDHIPVNLRVLMEAVSTGRWPIEYPPHEIPKRRWDLTINGILLIAVLLWMLFSLMKC